MSSHQILLHAEEDAVQGLMSLCQPPPQQTVLFCPAEHPVKYKGVYKTKSGSWKAQICHSGTTHCIGNYDTQDEAVQAYDFEAKRLGKPLHFPDKKGLINPKKRPRSFRGEQGEKSSKYKGVYQTKGGFIAEIYPPQGGKKQYLGLFKNEKTASEVYDFWALKYRMPVNNNNHTRKKISTQHSRETKKSKERITDSSLFH